MEEKNLVTLPDKVAEYLEFMKEKNYTLIGAFKIVIGSGETKDLMKKFFENHKNQENFARAWMDGYKLKEKYYTVKFKKIDGDGTYGYLNYNSEECTFTLSSNEETTVYQTGFTKKFLEENDFGWVFGCEGIKLEEVKNK